MAHKAHARARNHWQNGPLLPHPISHLLLSALNASAYASRPLSCLPASPYSTGSNNKRPTAPLHFILPSFAAWLEVLPRRDGTNAPTHRSARTSAHTRTHDSIFPNLHGAQYKPPYRETTLTPHPRRGSAVRGIQRAARPRIHSGGTDSVERCFFFLLSSWPGRRKGGGLPVCVCGLGLETHGPCSFLPTPGSSSPRVLGARVASGDNVPPPAFGTSLPFSPAAESAAESAAVRWETQFAPFTRPQWHYGYPAFGEDCALATGE